MSGVPTVNILSHTAVIADHERINNVHRRGLATGRLRAGRIRIDSARILRKAQRPNGRTAMRPGRGPNVRRCERPRRMGVGKLVEILGRSHVVHPDIYRGR